MKVAEIRSRFIKFFEDRNHTVVPSSSLIPHNDPSLLFTNAGMNQFKDVFTGKEKRPYQRATSVQKCVRAGGKHNDLESVGFTARHHTFFEMLGNFSFGDYFKREAIEFAWEFVTKELKLPVEKLYATVHLTDDEAAEIWGNVIGLSQAKISRFDKDNFWSMGDIGPCGPCSEIFFDRGGENGCGSPDCKVGCECDRYMEIWNLVFMQFDRNDQGEMTPLPRPSVDTGAGLERLASVMQESSSNYEIDLFLGILHKTAKLVGKTYQPGTVDAFALRVIADHSRATAFLIADGVMPANEGRGYVLRRIMRRAIRYGRNLGFKGPFLYRTSGYVIDEMCDVYPDLSEQRSFIEKLVIAEEEQFFKTLERGLALLDEELNRLPDSGCLSGDIAFRLYDTYGFPLDLTRVICEERSLGIDEMAFQACMQRQRTQSRKSWKGAEGGEESSLMAELQQDLELKCQLPLFRGYENSRLTSELVALFIKSKNETSITDEYHYNGADDRSPLLGMIFRETPFYGESGGQVGDTGWIRSVEFEGEVVDTTRPTQSLIVLYVKPKRGSVVVGNSYDEIVDEEKRQYIANNHTATHILHWALRDTLGEHVKQAGSFVTPALLRFDFSHYAALTSEELTMIENKVNERIWSNAEVMIKEMAKDEATIAGALAFFGEKYGDEVRVVKVGDFSTELCGGIHVKDTSALNLFKIVSESSIAAGLRRITAYTSKQAFLYLVERENEARYVKERLKANSLEEIQSKLDKLNATERQLRRQLDDERAEALGSVVDSLINCGTQAGDFLYIIANCPADATGAKKLRELADRIRQKREDAVLILGLNDGNKAHLLAAVGKAAQKSYRANDIITLLAPIIEGRGGGKADLAQAGGGNIAGLNRALDEARAILEKTT